jgi:hypothetical protein
VFVYNDADVAYRHISKLPNGSILRRSIDEFVMALAQQENVVMRTLDELVALFPAIDRGPFGSTIGIGESGTRVAEAMNNKTGLFPHIRPVPLRRVFPNGGEPVVTVLDGRPIQEHLVGLKPDLAIIDDTLWSGRTLITLLDALPPAVAKDAQVYCLQAAESGLRNIRARCRVTAAVTVDDTAGHGTIVKLSEFFRKTFVHPNSKRISESYCDNRAELFEWFGEEMPRIAERGYAIQQQLSL